MPEFSEHARNLEFGRVVIKSVTLSCSLVQMMAWNDVVRMGVYALLPLTDGSFLAVLVNALMVTFVSVTFVFATFRVMRCVQLPSVRIT